MAVEGAWVGWASETHVILDVVVWYLDSSIIVVLIVAAEEALDCVSVVTVEIFYL